MSNGAGDWQGRFQGAIGDFLDGHRNALAALKEFEDRGGAEWALANGISPAAVAGYVTAQYVLLQLDTAFKADAAYIPNLTRARNGEPSIGYEPPEEEEGE